MKRLWEKLFGGETVWGVVCIAVFVVMIYGLVTTPSGRFRRMIDREVYRHDSSSAEDLLLDLYYENKRCLMDECVEAVGESFAEDYAKLYLEGNGYLVFSDSVGVEEYAADHLECIGLDDFCDCGFTLEDLLEMSGMDAEDALGDLIDIMGRDRVIEVARNPR